MVFVCTICKISHEPPDGLEWNSTSNNWITFPGCARLFTHFLINPQPHTFLQLPLSIHYIKHFYINRWLKWDQKYNTGWMMLETRLRWCGHVQRRNGGWLLDMRGFGEDTGCRVGWTRMSQDPWTGNIGRFFAVHGLQIWISMFSRLWLNNVSRYNRLIVYW